MKTKQVAQTLGLATLATAAAFAQFPNFTPPTPLIGALMHDDTAEVKRLLAEGADPNEGKMLGMSPVFLAVVHRDKEAYRALRDKGARLTDRDAAGDTLLMWAAYDERGDVELVKELLNAGLDPAAKNAAGESAMTWAARRGRTPIVEVLERAGLSNQQAVRDSVQRALNLVQKSAPEFVRVSGCVSCHHTFLPQMTAAIARTRGLKVDEKVSRYETDATISTLKPALEQIAHNADLLPDPAVTVSYGLLGLAADRYPADKVTDTLTALIAKWQRPDGGFHAMPMRPPIEGSHFAATALSLRALQLYGKDSGEQVARAGKWLLDNQPANAEDAAFRLMGMGWAGASKEDLTAAAGLLLDQQHADGGWSQLPNLETDAYATGLALVALNWSKQMMPTEAEYRNGMGYLLRTQFADGSWLVRTRSFPVQPYKESGFPFAKDQWISATGTNWAAMALAAALPVQEASTDVAQQ